MIVTIFNTKKHTTRVHHNYYNFPDDELKLFHDQSKKTDHTSDILI